MLHLPQMMCMTAMTVIAVTASEPSPTLLWPTDLFLRAQKDSMWKKDTRKDMGSRDTADMSTNQDLLASPGRTVHMPRIVTVTGGGVYPTLEDNTTEEMTTPDTAAGTTQNGAETTTSLQYSTHTMSVPRNSEEIMILPFVADDAKSGEISNQHSVIPVSISYQNQGTPLLNRPAISTRSKLIASHTYGVPSSDLHTVSSTLLSKVPLKNSQEYPVVEQDKLHYMLIWNHEAERLDVPFVRVTNIWPQTGMVYMPIINQMSHLIQDSEAVKETAQKFKTPLKRTHTTRNSQNSVDEPVLRSNNFQRAWAWDMEESNTDHAMITQANSVLRGRDSILKNKSDPNSKPVEDQVTPVMKDNSEPKWKTDQNQNSSPMTDDAHRAQGLTPLTLARRRRAAAPPTVVRRPLRTGIIIPTTITTTLVPRSAGTKTNTLRSAHNRPDASHQRPVSIPVTLTKREENHNVSHIPVIFLFPSLTTLTGPASHRPEIITTVNDPTREMSPSPSHRPVINPTDILPPQQNPTAPESSAIMPLDDPSSAHRPSEPSDAFEPANPIAVPRPISNPAPAQRPITNNCTTQKVNGSRRIFIILL
ncbi:uncharacterized protein [Panulirus ornatus]|uniref:uncharacterized protein n=1 Tax=Panulirus ornatus TaxID=150431 RepID=UPI003A87CB66